MSDTTNIPGAHAATNTTPEKNTSTTPEEAATVAQDSVITKKDVTTIKDSITTEKNATAAQNSTPEKNAVAANDPAKEKIASAEKTTPATAGPCASDTTQAAKDKISSVATTIKESLVLRCVAVGFLTLLLQIPLFYFSDMTYERASTYRGAIQNIARGWGEEQKISGPLLIVPYQRVHRTKKGTVLGDMEHYIVLPKTVNYAGEIFPEMRHRGIYQYAVYTAPVTMQGAYELPEESLLYGKEFKVHWDKAVLGIGISDLKAINVVEDLEWNEKAKNKFSSGSIAYSVIGKGLYAKAPLTADNKTYRFSVNVGLKGSEGLFITPVGEQSTITISGAWGAPKFEGALLPTKRTITEKNFSAEWNVPSVSRSFPQHGNLHIFKRSGGGEDGSSISSFTAGVNLFEPVPLYRQVERAVKYGLLFIALTFVALLSFELINRSRLHIIQYGLVGFAMCLFYLTLLSLAEHIAFLNAFVAASLVCIVMNGAYITAALRSKSRGFLIAALLSVLYATLYAILQLEDYAILTGTGLILLMVAGLMFLTRNLGTPRK